MNFNQILESEVRPIDSDNNSVFEEIEYVPLASKGIFYPGKTAFLKMRKIDWRDEDILTTKSYYDNGKVIEEIINNCIRETGWTYDDLIPLDKDGLLIWLRMSAWDTIYDVNYTCPYCFQDSTLTWDLGEVEFPDLPEKYAEELIRTQCIKYPVKTQNQTANIYLTIPTLGHEKKVEAYLDNYVVENRKLLNNREFRSTGRLLSSIKSIEFNDQVITELTDIHGFLLKSGLSIRASREILKIAREINVSIKAEKEFCCNKNLKTDGKEDILIDGKPVKCGYKEPLPLNLPITINFFWPESDN